MKMIESADTPTPTVLGVLVLASRTRDFLPGAYIQFLRIAGLSLSDPVADELTIDGTIQDVLRRIDEKMVSHNRTSVDFTSGPVEKRSQPYPLAALQQLVRNAVTAANFGRPGVTDYRNPSLAEALRVLGFVQHFGAGIPTARRELDSNGNPPPEFTVEPTYVGVIVRSTP